MRNCGRFLPSACANLFRILAFREADLSEKWNQPGELAGLCWRFHELWMNLDGILASFQQTRRNLLLWLGSILLPVTVDDDG